MQTNLFQMVLKETACVWYNASIWSCLVLLIIVMFLLWCSYVSAEDAALEWRTYAAVIFTMSVYLSSTATCRQSTHLCFICHCCHVSLYLRDTWRGKMATSKCLVYQHPVFSDLNIAFSHQFLWMPQLLQNLQAQEKKTFTLCSFKYFSLSNAQGLQPSCFSRLIKIPHKARPHFVLIKSKKGMDLKQTQWLKETSALQAGKGQKNKNWIWFY